MAQDVFISYSSLDKAAADTVCSILEQNGISCWIAPRDITPGLDFSEAIIDGIKSSKLFILVYSSNSSNSKQVIREVDRAVDIGLSVVNLRLEDVPLSKQLEYYLSSVHWLDAISPPLEEHINKLSGVVKILLRKDGASDNDLEKAIRAGILRLGQDKKSIAVLPFKNLSNDPDQEYFSDGMMEEILDRLFKIGDLKVISRTSSMHYKNSSMSVKEIARELAVASIIEGSVRRIGNNVRIAVQLIDTGSDTHLWSEIYNGDLSDLSRIFVIQSEIAQSVARELKAVLSPQELHLIEKKPTDNIEAYDAYLKGQFYWRKLTKNDLDTAMQYFELAKEKDPKYALANAGICDVWVARQQMGFTAPSEAGPKAYEAVMKALEIDDSRAEVHYTFALMNTWGMWNWEGGENSFKKAIELNPNYAEAHAYYSHLLNILGKSEIALEEIELALKLDPLNPLLMSLYSIDLIFVQRYEDAIMAARRALLMDPTAPVALTALVMALFIIQKYEELIDPVKSIWSLLSHPEFGSVFDQVYIKEGFISALNKGADELFGQSGETYINQFELTLLYIMAGNTRQALKCIEKAYEVRDPNMPYLLSPIFDSLRDDPRFQEIAKEMNLPYK